MAKFYGASSPTSDGIGRLQYSPLDDSEIRLVTFSENPAPDWLDLALEHFRVEDAPPYLALSYVWGDASDTRPVRINENQFHITENLFEALQHIRSLASILSKGLQGVGGPGELHLWIDAICVDRGNLDEKSRQVPRIGHIFSSAYTVLVWLGTPERLGLDPEGFVTLIRLLNSISSLVGFTGLRPGASDPQQPVERDITTSKIILSYFRVLDSP